MTASLFIDGRWTAGSGTRRGTVFDPATGAATGEVAFAEKADLDAALAAAQKGFEVWRATSPFERGKVMRKAADALRAHADEAAQAITREQGKPVAEAKMEVLISAGTPNTRLTTPAGTPASSKHFTSNIADVGVSSGALAMIEQPAASAPASLRTSWLTGKFHGLKAATGPTGSMITACVTEADRPGIRRP